MNVKPTPGRIVHFHEAGGPYPSIVTAPGARVPCPKCGGCGFVEVPRPPPDARQLDLTSTS